MGAIPPLTEQDWLATFDKYKQFPEYQKLNKGMSLEGFKAIFMYEYLHRLLGRLIGVIFAFPLLYFAMRRRLRPGSAVCCTCLEVPRSTTAIKSRCLSSGRISEPSTASSNSRSTMRSRS